MRERDAKWLGMLVVLLAACGTGSTGGGSADAGECVDEDGDGYGVGAACEGAALDCDDTDPSVNPGAAELCGTDVDEDCDGEVDEGFEQEGSSCTVGEGICQRSGTWVCEAGSDALRCEAPGMVTPEVEVCNGLDDDCDGEVDEALDCTCRAGETQPCYTGSEETRGVGRCADGVQTCLPTGQWGDCEGAVLPGTETCNGADDDCNGLTDDVDEDGDGYWSCPGVAERDCDDGNRHIYPSAIEECNGLDDNCNGLVDEEVLTVYYLDLDGDGYGGGAANVRACTKPMGYAEVPGDCNDSNPDIHPGADEVCNDADDDCNGLVDDGLPLLDIYPDGDGDGYPPPGAVARQKCDVPIGWAEAQDPDGDGTPDWDCDDSDTTVHPAAEARCDGKDNDCDGYVDRWCAEGCGGDWPVSLGGSSHPEVAVADMNQDRFLEVGAGNGVGGKLLTHDGRALWTVTGSVNVVRQAGLFADVDFAGLNSRKQLEWVVGANSRPTFVRLRADGTAEARQSAASVGDIYDAGSYLARDLDGDGRAEIVAMRWSGEIVVLGYDAGTDRLALRAVLPSPDAGNIYTNGFSFGDTDGDGNVEIVFGTGYAYPTDPSLWRGRIYAFAYDHASGTFRNVCPGCFDTTVSGVYAGAVTELLLHDWDGDGSGELQAQVSYFSSNMAGVANPWAGPRTWTFDAGSGAAAGAPDAAELPLFLDLDGDGTAEAVDRSTWFVDVDGDGDYDRVRIAAGGYPILVFRDGSSEADGPRGGSVGSGARVRWLGDLDNDGRLDVLLARAGSLQCMEFGEQTYRTGATWTPLRRTSFYRTGQLDQAEPNEDRAHAFPLAVDGEMRGYVQNASDVDHYRLFAYCPVVYVQAPRGYDLRVRTWGDADRDGTLDAFADRVVAAGTTAGFSCTDHPSNPRGNLAMYVEVRGEAGAYSSTDFYRIRFKASF